MNVMLLFYHPDLSIYSLLGFQISSIGSSLDRAQKALIASNEYYMA